MAKSKEFNKAVFRYLFKVASITIFLVIALEINSTSGEELLNSINLSGEYIVNFTGPDGKFVYLVDPETNRAYQEKYNILRHSGTIYALGQLYGLGKQKNLLHKMILSSNYLKKCCILSVNGDRNVFAVWSLPAVNKSLKHKKAKLGGTGLGLVALVSLEKIRPGSTDIKYLAKLGNFILYMQKEDGSFYSFYTPAAGGRDDSWTSLYYPGEAALGLAMLYEIDPQQKWFEASVKALTYLAESRQKSRDVPPDHWALIATGKILSIAEEKSLTVPRHLLLNHGKQISETILGNVPDHPESSPVYGSLVAGGESTPTSVRIEGLIAFYKVLPDDHELKDRIKPVLYRGINFIERVQIKEGRYKGGIPKVYSAGHNKDARMVRIDYVQHALSAMVEYQNSFGLN